MPPKKQTKKTAEDFTEKFEDFRKKLSKNLKASGLAEFPEIEKTFYSVFLETGELPKCWNFTALSNSHQLEILSQTVVETNWKQLKGIRLFGVSAAADHPLQNSIKTLLTVPLPEDKNGLPNPSGGILDMQLVGCGMDEEACRVIGKVFQEDNGLNAEGVTLLNLNNNPIGSNGLKFLARGLCMHKNLRKLSLDYCQIGPEGGRFVSEILIFKFSSLVQLSLRGNKLQDEGLLVLFQMGLKQNKTLNVVDLSDNFMTESEKVLNCIVWLLKNKTNLTSFDFTGSLLTDVGAEVLLRAMVGLTHIKEFFIPQTCSRKTFEALGEILSIGGKKKKKSKK